jgi:Ribosomal protein S13
VSAANLKVSEWTEHQASTIREIIGAEFKVEGDLRAENSMNIRRLMDIGCYREIRHLMVSLSRSEHKIMPVP